jgi:protein-disulfide isomerase
LIFNFGLLKAETKINVIYEGDIDAKITLIVYESLTCSHCADFHKNVYPDLKKDFIDKGLVKIEFRNFPLDLAAFNASKVAHCQNDGKSYILHFLYESQKEWVKGNTIEEINNNLKNLIDSKNFGIDFDKCINNKEIEDHVLNDRISGMKKFSIKATPTLIINDKKFDKPLNYKNLKKTLEKLI